MLVLWDPSWTERLWCLFELAAFLKSRRGREQKLTVRPTLFGPCSIVAFCLVQALCVSIATLPLEEPESKEANYGALCLLMAIAFIVGQLATKFFRNYFHSIETLKEQLRNVSFDKTRSSCCDEKHVGASGEAVLCDRIIVKQCVCTWFGSEEAFEDIVRSTVLDTLTTELQFGVFSRTWTVGVAAPVFWTFLDLAATFSREPNEAAEYFLGAFAIWLLVLPSIVDA